MPVSVAYDNRRVSGRSILDMATLAAACGARLELETKGPDADAALDALIALVACGFGERDQ